MPPATKGVGCTASATLLVDGRPVGAEAEQDVGMKTGTSRVRALRKSTVMLS